MATRDRRQVRITRDCGLQVRWAAGRLGKVLGASVAEALPAFPLEALVSPEGLRAGGLQSRPDTGAEGYALTAAGEGVVVSALTEVGLANGLLAVARQARREGLGSVSAAVAQPCFARRDVYHFLTPWALPGLTTDTFTPSRTGVFDAPPPVASSVPTNSITPV